MHDAGAGARQHLDLGRLELRRVHADQRRRDEAERVEPRERPAARRGHGLGDFGGRLVHVHVDRHVELVREQPDPR